MKIIILMMFSILMASCDNVKGKEVSEKTFKNENACLPTIEDNAALDKEKVVISDKKGDELSYSKNDLKKIETLFPVLTEELARNPNEAYWFSGVWKEYLDEKGSTKSISFGSEAGRDSFCLIYAYYLKKRNGEEYELERKILVELYQTINDIYANLNYGGTYFGHQQKRLIAEAEYSIYLLKVSKEDHEKGYDFKKQKENYLKSLLQYVEDEESQNIENKMDKTEAKNRKKKFEAQLDVIKRLVTNSFYLNQVQKIEFENYR